MHFSKPLRPSAHAKRLCLDWSLSHWARQCILQWLESYQLSRKSSIGSEDPKTEWLALVVNGNFKKRANVSILPAEFLLSSGPPSFHLQSSTIVPPKLKHLRSTTQCLTCPLPHISFVRPRPTQGTLPQGRSKNGLLLGLVYTTST